MCGYTCARSFFFLISLLLLLVGWSLLGAGIYGLVQKFVHGENFFDVFFTADPALGEELKSRLMLYFLVVAGVCIGLGVILSLTGISAVHGFCTNFKTVTRYGNTKSSMGGFVFFIIIVLFSSGLVAATTLYIGIDGKVEENKAESTKSPDYKLNWKVLDLKETACQVYSDLVEFCWRTKIYEPNNKKDSQNFVTNALFLAGGVFCAVVVLTLIWLIVACCVSCGEPPVDMDYVYVSPEKKKYDDWIVNDRARAGY